MRLALVVSGVLAMAAMVGCGACEPNKNPSPAPSASGPVAAPSAPAPSVSARPFRPQPKLACRAITVEGDVRVERPANAVGPADAGLTPVLLQGLAPTETWIELGKGARLVVKDPRTTRETTFRGLPNGARGRVCVAFGEESWLTAGRFESTPGAGEAPGAEEWVITPFGVVRYAAAKVTVDVSPRETNVTVESGAAFVWSAVLPAQRDAGLEDGWLRITSGTTHLQSQGAVAGHAEAQAALDRCKTLASSARTLAAEVMSPDRGASASTIAGQVTTRREARAACGVATVRIDALPEAEAAALRPALAEAHSSWNGLPLAPSPSAAP